MCKDAREVFCKKVGVLQKTEKMRQKAEREGRKRKRRQKTEKEDGCKWLFKESRK